MCVFVCEWQGEGGGVERAIKNDGKKRSGRERPSHSEKESAHAQKWDRERQSEKQRGRRRVR